MNNKEQIQEMLTEGKITSDQASTLIKALKESEERRDRIFKQAATQKTKRKTKVYGFLIWLFGIVVFLCFLIFVGSGKKMNRDTHKAVEIFSQASIYLENEEYDQAIKYLHKGIKKDSQLSLGYSFLGLTYRILFMKTGEDIYQEKYIKSFQKAIQLENDERRDTMMSGTGFVFLMIFIVLVMSVTSIILMIFYNVLVKREEETNVAWAQIVALYQRKIDLIPALLDIVKNSAVHEKITLESVTQMRLKAQGIIEKTEGNLSNVTDELETSQYMLDEELKNMRVTVESYPDIKTNVNFLTMQQQLEQTEDGILKGKESYNVQVKKYNSLLRSFPFNIVASVGAFFSKGYFKNETVV